MTSTGSSGRSLNTDERNSKKVERRIGTKCAYMYVTLTLELQDISDDFIISGNEEGEGKLDEVGPH